VLIAISQPRVVLYHTAVFRSYLTFLGGFREHQITRHTAAEQRDVLIRIPDTCTEITPVVVLSVPPAV